MAISAKIVVLVATCACAHAFAPRARSWTAPRAATARGSTVDAAADAAPAGDDVESYQFEAEVSRVMDIIVNSLYSDRDVFLRELVSNAADACDKRRFLSIDDSDRPSLDADDLRVRIKADKEARTLTLEDNGVGMTRDEIKNNLGRIAQSGTKKFMEALGSGDADVSLIGQFGVGFYSAYLVADEVTVVSKSMNGGAAAEQLRWNSKTGEGYTIALDASEPFEEDAGGCGTRITLHLKEDCDEYLDEFKLRELLKRYSEFIGFPIELYASKTTYEQVPDDEAEPPAEGEEPKMKSVPVTTEGYETMNLQKPIWVRSPRQVNESEYFEFYKSTFKAYDTPASFSHFALEGQVQFRSVLFVPATLPFELSRNMFDESSHGIKLYVKRVFINDRFEDLLPRWLTFIRGVVDSEDLPLNVGREILQKSRMLSIINKRLVRKCLDMFNEIAAKDDGTPEGEYAKFWSNFGKYLKVGIVEEPDYKDELAGLCRFWSTKSGDQYTSLADYVSRMQTNQTQIFYVTGDGKQAAAMSPVLEKLRSLDYEVLYMTEPLDELTAQSIAAFKGDAGEDGAQAEYDLVDAAKEDLSGLDALQSEDELKELEAKRESLEDLCGWIKEALGSKVTKVDVSGRLTSSPAALVQSSYGMSPTMQRYMKAQAVAMGESENLFGVGAAALEINPDHPVVTALAAAVEADRASAEAKAQVALMYDVAALTGGYTIEDPGAFASRVIALMGGNAPAGGAAVAEFSEVVDEPTDGGAPAEAAEVETAEVDVVGEGSEASP